MTQKVTSLANSANDMNNCPLDKIHTQNSYPLPTLPGDLNNPANQLPPSYESTLEQTASPARPASTERTLVAPPLSQLKPEDANRVLDYADYAWEKQNWAKAQTHYTTAAAIFRIVGDSRNEAFCLQRVGEICRILRQFRAARTHILQAHILFGQCGEIARQLMCERWLARTASDEGNLEEARLLLHTALDSSRSSGLRESEGWCLLRLGEIEGAAKDLIQQALDIAREEKLPLLETRCLEASSARWKKTSDSQPPGSPGGIKMIRTGYNEATSKEGVRGSAAPNPNQITGTSGKDATPGPSQANSLFSRWFNRSAP